MEEVVILAIHELTSEVTSVSFFLLTCLRGLTSIAEGFARRLVSSSVIASVSLLGGIGGGATGWVSWRGTELLEAHMFLIV